MDGWNGEKCVRLAQSANTEWDRVKMNFAKILAVFRLAADLPSLVCEWTQKTEWNARTTVFREREKILRSQTRIRWTQSVRQRGRTQIRCNYIMRLTPTSESEWKLKFRIRYYSINTIEERNEFCNFRILNARVRCLFELICHWIRRAMKMK